MLTILNIILIGIALASWDGKIIQPQTSQVVNLSGLAALAQPGDIIILGEDHDNLKHHQNQVDFLKSLALQHPTTPINVGMEFIDVTQQEDLDQFLSGNIDESSFLKRTKWSGIPFSYYRDQVLFSRQTGGHTFGINLPMSVARDIRMIGVENLPKNERALLPDDFTVGNDLYFERFVEAMGPHPGVSRDVLRSYFVAHSAWDDTMAATSVNIMSSRPNEFLVIIVGNFHLAYGGGLPDRLKARGARSLFNIPQINAGFFNSENLQQTLKPHQRYGYLGDYVWISGEPNN